MSTVKDLLERELGFQERELQELLVERERLLTRSAGIEVQIKRCQREVEELNTALLRER